MGADADITVTPRPDLSRRRPQGARTATPRPPALHDELTGELGRVPALPLLGPDGDRSPRPSGSSRRPGTIMREHRPDLTLAYLPHLDYDLQRFGPDVARGARGRAPSWTPRWRRCSTTPRGRGSTVVVLSEYGITEVDRPVAHQPGAAPRRAARGAHAGGHGVPRPVDLARVRRGRPPGRARVRARPGRHRQAVARCVAGAAGRGARCSTRASKARYGLDHARAGELVARRRARRAGSPTTTGSTTRARPTSPAPSTSTASPATTPPSCSSTRRPRGQAARPGASLARKKLGHPLHDERRAAGRRAWVQGHPRPAAGRPARRAGAAHLHTGRLRETVAATGVRDLVLQVPAATTTTTSTTNPMIARSTR